MHAYIHTCIHTYIHSNSRMHPYTHIPAIICNNAGGDGRDVAQRKGGASGDFLLFPRDTVSSRVGYVHQFGCNGRAEGEPDISEFRAVANYSARQVNELQFRVMASVSDIPRTPDGCVTKLLFIGTVSLPYCINWCMLHSS